MKMVNTLNNDRGLSLVELITTMVIAGLLASAAIPNFTGWKTNYQIRTETEKIHMDLILARMTAIKNNNNVVVTFLDSQNKYTILDDTNNNLAADAGETLRSIDLDNEMQYGFYGSVMPDMDNNNVTENVKMGATDVVTFDARGQASVSGVLFLIHGSDLAQSTNQRLRGINIIQATGAAELWEYNSSLSPPWE